MTTNTQPVMLVAGVAAWRVWRAEGGAAPAALAGHSLGEYSALVASGALAFEDAIALLAKRGEYMETAAPAGTGKMVAVLNTDVNLIEEICSTVTSGIVSPANYNTPAQIVIGGEVAAVDEAVELLKEAGVKRMIPLNVSGPFHTALLKPASDQLALALEQVDFADFRVPLVGNTQATVMKKDEIRFLLTRQVMEPVRFYESIATMQEAGVTNFIEIGPGKILSGFVNKIDRTAHVVAIEDIEGLQIVLNKS